MPVDWIGNDNKNYSGKENHVNRPKRIIQYSLQIFVLFKKINCFGKFRQNEVSTMLGEFFPRKNALHSRGKIGESRFLEVIITNQVRPRKDAVHPRGNVPSPVGFVWFRFEPELISSAIFK
ncbi:TPA: hypothetical protein DDY55_04275 [Candidatus Falkowbacteria bacterium]|nr:hypothetical protein [Candidatus Falkowbacteria bacterium]HAY12142.1 hypothetical protein [Candidatus Falkowbacteria bacterium]HBI97303.1 hypothetical protein [Candidatus Falkowbacteria bacterium]HBT28046.1 hypothetical protein [Candidatus Falkowbacteria bacterium]HBY14510.1 hypothetical protein [Candidatus Falkowbacteria bacterium]